MHKIKPMVMTLMKKSILCIKSNSFEKECAMSVFIVQKMLVKCLVKEQKVGHENPKFCFFAFIYIGYIS